MKKIITMLFIIIAINAKAQRMKSDTLVITDTAIHFITIGSQTFEIQRTVSLVPAPPTNKWPFSSGNGLLTFPTQNGITLLSDTKQITGK
jgi:hypothetical protein